MKPGDLHRRNRFFAPGCEWRGEGDRSAVYMFVEECPENWKGVFLGPDGLVELHYAEMMERVE